MPITIDPRFRSRRFTCPQCGTVAEQDWWTLSGQLQTQAMQIADFAWCVCKSCESPSLWTPGYYPIAAGDEDKARMVWPVEGGPPPHEDMPADALRHYNEARSVLGASPQAAAALLRVATQAIVEHLLGRTDLTLDSAIGELVRMDQIRTSVKQACDVLRVTGNNNLHPGQIDADDATGDIALRLFRLVNLIVEQAITEPRLVAELHGELPATKLTAIENRDRRALASRTAAE